MYNFKNITEMKKTLTILSLLFVCLFGTTALWSCDDDEKEEPAFSSELPGSANAFLDTYYPGIKVAYVNIDKDNGKTTYDVSLNNGHQIEFSATGEWLDVDAPEGQAIPSGIAPQAIVQYLATNYAGSDVINEISRESYGYNVELANHVDLMFSSTGEYLGVDK